VFLSSHLLAEVEKIITDIAIIGSNKVHFNGKLNDLQNSQNMILKISTNDNEKANLLVSSFLGVVPTQEVDSWVLYHLNHKEHVPNIIKLLIENNLDIYKIVADVNPLEDIFLDYTNQ
jgi:ABC-2 type transport system ATP-binding protein